MVKLRKALYILLGVSLVLYLADGILFPEPPNLPLIGVLNTYFWLVMIIVGTICAIILSFAISFIRFLISLLK